MDRPGLAKQALMVCFLVMGAGFFFGQDRAIEIAVAGIGSIKASAEQARRDAAEIAAIRTRLDFYSTVAAARADDRMAFDRLRELGDDPDFEFREQAVANWVQVLDKHRRPMHRSGFTPQWPDGVDPQTLDIQSIQRIFAAMPAWQKPAIIEYVWEQERFSLASIACRS